MKILFVVAVVIAAVSAGVLHKGLSEEKKEKLKQYSKECIDETKLDEKILKEAKEKQIYPDIPELKTFSLCFSKKSGSQNEKGEIQMDVIKKHLAEKFDTEEEIQKMIDDCVVAKDTPELTAFNMFTCFHKKAPQDLPNPA